MAVNALVTGLIVFKIRKVFVEVQQVYASTSTSESDEQTLGSTGGGGGSTSKLQHIIFVIIESGMSLLAIQLVRFVLLKMETVPNSHPIANLVLGSI
jgi:hypothetical protein